MEERDDREKDEKKEKPRKMTAEKANMEKESSWERERETRNGRMLAYLLGGGELARIRDLSVCFLVPCGSDLFLGG